MHHHTADSMTFARGGPRTRSVRACTGMALALTPFLLAACNGTSIKSDSELRGDLNGNLKLDGALKADLNTALKLDGPVQIQMQIQGPTIKYEGVYITDKLLERVKVGETGADWILAVFGEPTGKGPLQDGSEIWKWAYIPLEEKAALLSVFGGGAKDAPTPQPSTAYVRLKNGMVVEKWRN